MTTFYKRIDALVSLVNSEHNLVYDLCCDHGKLGLACNKPGREVYLVDQVDSIIQKLIGSDIPPTMFPILADATEFEIKTQIKKTIIIAGIGGHLAIKILNNILPQTILEDEIILCAHSHEDVVWSYLEGQKDIFIKDSILLEEQNEVYEIYLIKIGQGDLNRERIFKTNKRLALKYLQEKIDYYQLKSQHNQDPINMLEYYQKLLNSLKIT